MSAELTFNATGRSPRTAAVVGAVWLGLLALWLVLDAAPWVVGFLALFTLPACWDLLRNPPSGLTLTQTDISWHSGTRKATVELQEIDHVRLDTRLDFSVRVTLVLVSGAKLRLPFEATPPHQSLEDALNAQGIKTQRHHFQLLQ